MSPGPLRPDDARPDDARPDGAGPDGARPRTLRPKLGWLLRLGFSVAVLAALVHLLDARAVATALSGADPVKFGLAVAALWLQILLSAMRWRLTAGAMGLHIGRARAVSEYHLSMLGNSLLPGGVAGDLGRIARARHGGGLRLAAGSVILERLAGQVALGVALGVGVVLWFWPDRAAVLTAAGMAALALAAASGRAPLPRALRDGLARAWLAPGVWQRQLGLGAAILACNLFGVWAAAAAVGATLSPLGALFVIPPTLLAMLAPISVNGWGLREGAAAALWPLAGIAPALAVAGSVAFGLAALAAVLVGCAAVGLGGVRRRRAAAGRTPGG